MFRSNLTKVEDKLLKYKSLIAKDESNIETFLRALTDIITAEKVAEQPWLKNIPRHKSLLKELEKVRKLHDHMVLSIDATFENIMLKCVDRLENDQFFLLTVVNSGIYKIKEHSLPNVKELTCEFSGIDMAVNTFKECLNQFSDYLETMADIDALCWVIDPVNPTSKDNYRRIIIGDDISAIITVDETGNGNVPEIKLLGPSRITEPLTEAMYQVLWNHDEMVTTNLMRMLDLDHFPSRNELKDTLAKGITDELECSICLAGRNTSGDLPSVICEKSTCRQQFHSDCLYQWLSAIYPAVSSNVQRFNVMYGECPSCNMPISCPVP